MNNADSSLQKQFYSVPYTCRCAKTVVPAGGREVDDGAGRDAETTERLAPVAELLELGLGGTVLHDQVRVQPTR